tara:strand:+ start:3876 stop:4247 length:372 start_codon:yes stop_codon:yes gene_type:complete
MSGDLLQNQVDEIRKLMETRLRIRGKTLDQQVRKAGRLLPRALRRDATYLAHAATVMQHPKLARMVDGVKATSAHARLALYLTSVDPKDRARGKLLAWLGSLAFGFLVVVIMTVVVLVQRGIV